ncbi:ExeM/NucH family extracellular endonuclease [Shewanella chilikensis]|uniref:ExeM/NucH family extracellular endonuclease n=1 Tax=Shewanella TaxID=22 RepID=UPI00200F1B97|nr:ExeM/NucH family extracellular endonuclease [Shewanella chilikensis]MCL1161708.1 ExeM/NucH family extracellular endonuclease [Shewanella chilikensis]
MLTKASLLALAVGSIAAQAQASEQVIISEYVEGSGNNKAIELFNAGSQAVDLSQYQLDIFFNGSSSAGSSIALSGMLAVGGTHVLADNDANAAILALAQQTSSASFFNGDDALVLSRNGKVVDSLGQVGVDPGSEWGSGDVSTQNNTLRRKLDNLSADLDPFDAVDLSGWDGFAIDNIDDLGAFGGNAGEPGEPTDPGNGALVCGDAATPIHALQGSGEASPLAGETLEVEAIVTSNQEAGLKGLFLQMADAEADADPLTSEGVFLYTGNSASGYQAGDRIRVRAQVTEYQGLTELTNVSAKALCATSQPLPSAARVSLPVNDSSALEAFEGMLVSFEQHLTVNEVYNLGRYGEVLLGSSRHFIGTQVANPGADALAVTAANALDSIVLDDGLTAQNPDPVIYPAPGLSAANPLRVGDTVTNLTAVMHYGFGIYRLMPVDTVNFVAANPRASEPELNRLDALTVASFNVLNYFNGDGQGGGFPTSRGADTQEEFERQRAKIIAAMKTINADVFGLMEIENDGFGSNSAIADLARGLNDAIGTDSYRYLAPQVNRIGNDEISVGILYRQDRVTPEGVAAILDSSNSALDDNGQVLFNDGKNRPMLTQKFSVNDSEDSFVVAVNHLKSKGSDCNALGDPDMNDGQGNCNLTRTRAAMAIGQFLQAEYQDDKVLVIGDLNAYAKEDPLTTLANAGYAELFGELGKPSAYSYVFSGESGQLDHALANEAMLANVRDVTDWHINTDEPRVLDYNTEFKTPEQLQSFYSNDAFRSSDHDPVIIALDFAAANQAPVAEFSVQQNGAAVALSSTSSDSDGELVSLEWDLGDGTQAFGEQVSHEYQQSGVYLITLTVTDDKGAQHSVSREVTVEIAPEPTEPVAVIRHLDLWLLQVFISESYDPDGYIKKQQWRFNDGRRFNGPVAMRIGGRANEVTLTVTDNDKQKASTSLSF